MSDQSLNYKAEIKKIASSLREHVRDDLLIADLDPDTLCDEDLVWGVHVAARELSKPYTEEETHNINNDTIDSVKVIHEHLSRRNTEFDLGKVILYLDHKYFGEPPISIEIKYHGTPLSTTAIPRDIFYSQSDNGLNATTYAMHVQKLMKVITNGVIHHPFGPVTRDFALGIHEIVKDDESNRQCILGIIELFNTRGDNANSIKAIKALQENDPELYRVLVDDYDLVTIDDVRERA
tara:strand:+ start:23048 stop:23755 length:708 start_codon:yes stop_codon:yes gene_type:complete